MNIPSRRWGSDSGFSLVELMVVIIIVAILAAVAIPLYMNQQEKAHDSAAQSDAMNLGLLIRAAWDEGDGVGDVEHVNGSYVVDGEPVLGSSPGVEFVTYTGSALDDWCVQLRHPSGDKSADPGVRFDSEFGYVESAEC